MDLTTLIPRTLVGVVYPAFMSLKSVLHGSPESAGAWLRYWVVLGVFSLVELLLDPVINPLRWVIILIIRIYLCFPTDLIMTLNFTLTNVITLQLGKYHYYLIIICLQLLLPYLSGSEVSVSGVVHAASLMEWVRSPVQPSEFRKNIYT